MNCHQLRLLGLALLYCNLAPGWLWAQLGVDPTIENAKKVGSLVDRSGKSLGSCFYVDRRGYVATSFSCVEPAVEAMVVFNSGDRFAVVGVVAASRGKDIAILALKGMPDTIAPLTIRAAAVPLVGDQVMRWGGPLAEKANVPVVNRPNVNPVNIRAADSIGVLPKVAYKLLGDEYQLGLAEPQPGPNGCDPDAEWIWIDQPRHGSCAGGPVFDRAGDVVAMVSVCLQTQLETSLAIQAKHIVDLIPVDEPKLTALVNLRKWTDAISYPKDQIVINEDTNGLGGSLQRGLELAARYRDLQRRLMLAEQLEAKVAKQRAQVLARSLELAPEIEKVNQAISAIMPEEKYIATETRTRRVKVDKDDKKGGGKYENEKYEVKVTKYRYSARQLATLESLQQELATQRAELMANEVTLKYLMAQHEPYIKRLRSRLAEGIFYDADPLCLRPHSEHESFVTELTQTIEDGGAPGIIYLLRAMSRTSLGQHVEAVLDLKEATDADPKLQMLAQAVEARGKIMAGKAADGNKELTRAVSISKNDPRVLMLAARGALDRRDPTVAVRYLTLAAAAGPNNEELKLCLAWVCVTGPNAGNRQALENAEAAVRMTAGRDWSAVAALAAAHARVKEFDKAALACETAIRLAPASASELCRGWQAQIASKQPIQRLWK